MNNFPLVSIVTVCYNSSKTISQTIKSVLNQTYENYEYIIIDGNSQDSTVEIIKDYESKFNGKMVWISEKDKGIYDAMNKGINLAKGELVGIINSDDWYERNALEIVVEEFNRNPEFDIYYGLLRIIDKNEKEVMVIRNNHNNLLKAMIQHPSCFLKRDAYKMHNAFDIKYRSAADFDFFIRLFKNGALFKPIDNILANFRVGGACESTLGLKETNEILYKHKIISWKKYLIKKHFIQADAFFRRLLNQIFTF